MKTVLAAMTLLLAGFICGYIYAGGMNPPHSLSFSAESWMHYQGELNADMIEKLNSEAEQKIHAAYRDLPYDCFVLPDGANGFRVYYSPGAKFVPTKFQDDLGRFYMTELLP